MTNEEKNNILDQHKTIYDGYVTQYGQSKEQPLYVQDFANDKGGITLNNKGEVGVYRNTNINEMRFDNKSTGLFQEEESEYISVGEQIDMIGDGDDDLIHGTYGDDYDDKPEMCTHCGGIGFDEDTEETCEWCDGSGECKIITPDFDDESPANFDDIDVTILNLDDDIRESIQENINKSLEMFRRFNNY